MREKKEVSFNITLSLERDGEMLSWFHSIPQDEREKTIHGILKDHVTRRSREELREELREEMKQEIFQEMPQKIPEHLKQNPPAESLQ